MKHWIFQGNPKRFTINSERYPDFHNINDYVKKGKIIEWSIRQKHFQNEIEKGDQVFIWRSDGDEPKSGGIIALTEIVSEIYLNASELPTVELKVLDCRLDEEQGMLLRHILKEIPETEQLLIIRAPQMTNYKLSDQESDYIKYYWDHPEELQKRSQLPLLDKYLQYYKAELEQGNVVTEFDYIEDSHRYFQQYRSPEFIKNMEWEDFQKIGEHVNAFRRMAIARSRAFGDMNAPIEQYRKSFSYLIHGEEPINERLDRFLQDPDFKLFGIGANAVSEIIGNVFPDKYCFYNQRDRVAVENELLIDPYYTRGDSFGDKFLKFQNALQENEIAKKYELIVGRHTDLPIYFEVDQFFSFLFEKRKSEVAVDIHQPRFWLLAAGRDGYLWKNFLENELISIGWKELGDLRNYKDRKDIAIKLKELHALDYTPSNDALANEQFVYKMKEGDFVFVKRGTSTITALGEIKSEYKYDTEAGDHHSYRDVTWIEKGEWDVSDLPIHIKTLTDVTDYEDYLEKLMSRVETQDKSKPYIPNPEEQILINEEIEIYSIDDMTKDVFMDVDKIDDAIESLNYKKNIILQGPPGVGKTFIAKRLAYLHMEKKQAENIQMVQFHQSYSYEEFIMGFKPSESGNFELRKGLFYTFCKEAEQHPDENYYFIIDEINRGNLSKIFGEVMMLMEADKRGNKHAIKLAYSEDEELFSIPENVYIIAMMNTADRSLAMVDYALRRRFAFIDLIPGFHTDSFKEFLKAKGVSIGFIDKIKTFMNELNHEISSDTVNLGKGFEIGHSYFCPDEEVEDEQWWFDRVIRLEIKPLLSEYWFDQEEKVDDFIQRSE